MSTVDRSRTVLVSCVRLSKEFEASGPRRYPYSSESPRPTGLKADGPKTTLSHWLSVLADLGVDLIDCSSGGNSPDAVIPVAPGYQVQFAQKIRHETAMRTAAVGMITEPQQADDIISSGSADIVLLAREFLRNPYWPVTAARPWMARFNHPCSTAGPSPDNVGNRIISPG